jgi:hypothetical protein
LKIKVSLMVHKWSGRKRSYVKLSRYGVPTAPVFMMKTLTSVRTVEQNGRRSSRARHRCLSEDVSFSFPPYFSFGERARQHVANDTHKQAADRVEVAGFVFFATAWHLAWSGTCCAVNGPSFSPRECLVHFEKEEKLKTRRKALKSTKVDSGSVQEVREQKTVVKREFGP